MSAYRLTDGSHLYIRDGEVVAVVPDHCQCVIDKRITMSPYLKDGEILRTRSDGSRVLIDRNGNVIEVVEDGGTVRVPMVMMDAAKKIGEDKTPTLDASVHRPREGIRSLEDRARVDATRIKNEQRKADAWKNPTKQEIDVMSGEIAYQRSVERIGTANPKKPDDWVEPEKAWDRMRKRTEEAWRNPPKKT